MIADNSAASIEAFVRANVKPGATLLTHGRHASYPGLTDYRHDPRIVGNGGTCRPAMDPPGSSIDEAMELGHDHGLRRKHLDTYQ